MIVFHSDRHRLHDPQHELEAGALQPPFESPRRADVIAAALADADGFEMRQPAAWGSGPIEAVHDAGLVRFLATAWEDYQREVGDCHDVVPDVFALAGLRRGMGGGREPTPVAARLGQWCFETTTPLTAGTYEAVRSAVDVALSTAAAVSEGERVAYGLCRPPGHHAASTLYGGYCFFNNAAITAHHLATTTGERVVVLDVDYHHGNGTQEIFYERDDVAFVSLHGDPVRAYPYHTGHADETGSGRGRGANVNLPLAAGIDDDGYVAALERALDAACGFEPGFVVVSLGLDTYRDDPICDLAVSAEGFTRCGEAVASRGLPLVVLQEGGYADDALGANVAAWLTAARSAR